MAATDPHTTAPGPFPVVTSPLNPDEIRARLDSAARRGKLPGLQPAGPGPALFSISDFGRPFESVLTATASQHAGLTHLLFTARPKPLMPLVLLVLLIATVWPGVWLTHSMLVSYFPGYTYKTWMWYIPLTAPTVPWGMWSYWRKSIRSAAVEGAELIAKVAALVDGRANGVNEPASAAAAPELVAERA